MSWTRVKRSSTWYIPKKRASITLDAVDTSSDYTITIPKDWSDFWDDVDSSGLEIEVTDADGLTTLTYQWSSFTSSTRTGVLQIDNYTSPVNGIAQIWLYWGMSGASTGAGSFSASSPRNGYVDLGAVVQPIATAPERPGDTIPLHRVSKASTETIWVWLDFGKELVRRDQVSDEHSQWEEIDGVTYAVTLAGVAQGGMVSASSPRVHEGRYVRLPVLAGSSGSDYTLSATITTTYPAQQSGRVLVRRAMVQVKDVSEA